MVDFSWNYMAQMLKEYKQNLPPILKFTEHAYQGKLELFHNFQAKIMLFTVQKSRLIRRDIIMESLAPSLQYHKKEKVKTILESLVLQ